MSEITILDKQTIDKIAAGEVVERPSSVVKELLENSIDSGAEMISVEIRNGGKDLIRVTDNGSGIRKDQIKKALLRHSTSKIKDSSDLSCIKTLGFRGEALSSICAVSRMEILTKTEDAAAGAIYKINGGIEESFSDAGLPDGTTVIVRDLFYNIPARLKFLKSSKTEAGHISEIIEKLALSHPDISFKFISSGQLKLMTSGNGSLMDAIFSVFGRDISSNIIEVSSQHDTVSIDGYIGKPEIARSSRSLENFFINGRYIKDKVISKALEDAYYGYHMKGTFPFSCFNITIDPSLTDVNVHPSKLEIKFFDSERVYKSVYTIISEIISGRENIPEFSVSLPIKEEGAPKSVYDPSAASEEDLSKGSLKNTGGAISAEKPLKIPEPFEHNRIEKSGILSDISNVYTTLGSDEKFEQTTLSDNKFISQEAVPKIRIIGQIFGTYWIAEFEDKMYMIDQHAAHEKVLYEKFMAQIAKGEILSQSICPPVIVSLSPLEEVALEEYMPYFEDSGFKAEHFGGSEYALTAVPADLYSSIDPKELFLDMLSELSRSGNAKSETLLGRVASAACKAAVKGNTPMSFKEAQSLADSLLSLENPYNCPHGRPTMIMMSKYELEKKFKRII